MSWLPMSGSVRCVEDDVVARDRDESDQHHPPQLHDGPDAPDVVHQPEQGSQRRPDEDAELGAVQVMKIDIGTRIPTTIASPPMRGTGILCTRGRSVLSSTPPMRGASTETIGVSTRTMAAATRNPHSAEDSSTSARRESGKDMEGSYSRGNRRPPLVRSNACDRACDIRAEPSTNDCARARRRSESSASATPGCRSRWRSRRPGSRSPASIWTRRR